MEASSSAALLVMVVVVKFEGMPRDGRPVSSDVSFIRDYVRQCSLSESFWRVAFSTR